MNRSRMLVVYDALLRLLPGAFRDRYGAEIRETFEEEWRESSTPHRVRMAARGAISILWMAIASRVRPGLWSPTPADANPPGFFSGFSTDARMALRGLRHRPAFFATAVVTIALGIGAATAVFSVVDSTVLRAVHIPERARVMTLWGMFKQFPGQDFGLSAAELADLRSDVRSFARVGAWMPGTAVLEPHDDHPARTARAAFTVGDIYSLVGARVVAGRLPAAQDDYVGATPVAVISHDLWLSEFEGDATIVGKRRVSVGKASAVIVGVLADDATLPGQTTDIWVHRVLDPASWATNRSGHGFTALALLRRGVSEAAARAELASLERTWAMRYSGQHSFGLEGHTVMVAPLVDRMLGTARRIAALLSIASGLLLLLGAMNVANLLLARGETRSAELGVRLALGASTRRMIQPVIVEGVIIAGVGSVLGLALPAAGLPALMRVAPADLAAQTIASVDARAAAFAVVLSLVTGVSFSVAPAWIAATRGVSASMRAVGTAGRGRTGATRGLRTLVAAQTALAALLLSGAGLFVRSLQELNAVKPGLDPVSRVAVDLSLPQARFTDAQSILLYYSTLEQRLQSVPGVDHAALVRNLPLRDGQRNENVLREGSTNPEDIVGMVVQTASAGVLQALGVPLIQGRDLATGDRAEATHVALINQSAARLLWPGESPVGKRVRAMFTPPAYGFITIVGVYGDVRSGGLSATPRPEIILPIAQGEPWVGWLFNTTVVAHATVAPSAAIASLQSAIHDVDANIAIQSPTTMSDVVRSSAARERFLAVLLVVFAALALLIAAVGVFAVVSFTVARQARELAIRRALGSADTEVLTRVLWTNAGVAAAGACLGALVALVAAPTLSSLLFAERARDGVIFAGVPIVLTAVAVVACLRPAIRTMRTPLVAALNNAD